MTGAARSAHLVEVLPRDGLQSLRESQGWRVPGTADKIRFIELAAAAGLPEIEITGFVHPRVVPQLADAEAVVAGTAGLQGVTLRVLVPNLKGALRALDAGARKLSALIVASESYQRRNANMTIAQNLAEIERIAPLAQRHGVELHVGIGMCFGCPYEGSVPLAQVLSLVDRVVALGVHDLSIADSIGCAGPGEVAERVDAILQRHPRLSLGLHLHATGTLALANVQAGWHAGARKVETCTGGHGGGIAMPHDVAPPGNVATEDVVRLFEGSGVPTGVDLRQLQAAARWIEARLAPAPP